MSAANKVDFIRITPMPEMKKGKKLPIKIDFGYNILSKEPENGYIPSYIPALDVYFYARNEDEKIKIATSSGGAFISHWVNQEGFSSFLRQLRILGFEPAGGVLDWRKMLDKKKFDADVVFKPRGASKQVIPALYAQAKKETIHHHYEMAY